MAEVEMAVEASNMKSLFVVNISHEIRTPMNGVVGMAEHLAGMGLTDDQRECAEQVVRSGEQMLSIINDILDISKIETGHLEVDVGDFDLTRGHPGDLRGCGPSARAKGPRLELRSADGVPRRVRGDGRRLAQVLLNLVSNAVKFTLAGSITVAVGAEKSANSALPSRLLPLKIGGGRGSPSSLRRARRL